MLRNPKEILEPMPLDQNFTLIDLRAVALASVLFSLFGFAPGYALGWCTNALSFRRRLLSTRLLIAVVISVSVNPGIVVLGWSAIGLGDLGCHRRFGNHGCHSVSSQ